MRPKSVARMCRRQHYAGRFRPASESQTGCPWGASDQLPSQRPSALCGALQTSFPVTDMCGALQISFQVTDRVPCVGRFRPASQSQTGCPVRGASDQLLSHRQGALCGALQTSVRVTDMVPCLGFRVWGASEQLPSHRHGARSRGAKTLCVGRAPRCLYSWGALRILCVGCPACTSDNTGEWGV